MNLLQRLPHYQTSALSPPVGQAGLGFMTHKGLWGLTEAGQAWEPKGDMTMAKKDPDKVLKDLRDYRLDGDRQRLLDEIDSYMDVELVSDTHATVKHAYLGFVPDDEGVDRLTCELAAWEMQWDKQAACWVVEDWASVEMIFQIDFTKDRIPWKKVRALNCWTDEKYAEIITMSPRFENEFIAATAKLAEDEDDIYSVIADPLLRKAFSPPEDQE
jgi:hypothetical protein